MTTTQHTSEVLSDGTLGELEGALAGPVIRPADPDYDSAREVWNAAHDRRPAVIVRPTGVADVKTAVEFARSHGLPVAVRSGAHSIAGFSTCDDGIVIDLGAMKGVRIDPVAGRAVVAAGMTWKEIDHETAAFGRATTGGLVSSTGIGGFCTGGGIGWLLRRHGLTCDNLVGADIVTADSKFIHVSADEHADLFWALRGGGGNFGVVTAFELAVHPVPATMLGGAVFYRGEDAGAIIRAWRELTPDMPDELTTLLNCATAPPLPFLPESFHGQPMVVVAALYDGSPDEGERFVKPLRELATPVADVIGPIPYVGMQTMLDPLYVDKGSHSYFTSAFVHELSDQAIEDFTAAHRAVPSPMSELHIHQLGGAFARVPADQTAFTERSAPYLVNIINRSVDSKEYAGGLDWARSTRDQMAGYGRGTTYVNFTGEAGDDKVRASYPSAIYDRLVSVKDRYDPSNLFRLNQNIRPSGWVPTPRNG